MENKKMISIVLGLMCVALTIGICMQIRTVNDYSTKIGQNYDQNNLRAEVLKYKERYENKVKDIEKIDAVFRENAHVDSVHHLHVWAISTTDVALTAHVVIDDLSRMAEIKDSLKHELHEIGINHSTLEIEGRGEHCHSESCDCAGDSGL